MHVFYISIKEETIFKRRSVEAIILFRSSCSCLSAVKLDKEEQIVFEFTSEGLLAWKIPRTEEPGKLHAVHGVAQSRTRLKRLRSSPSSSSGSRQDQ